MVKKQTKLIKKKDLPRPKTLRESLHTARRNLISSLAEIDRLLERVDLIDNGRKML